ncbi:pyridoxal-5'-phosphate-dependent protein subunit beta, partial [Nocardia gipuzkoensis]
MNKVVLAGPAEIPAALVAAPGAVLRPHALVGNTPVMWIGAPVAPPGPGFWAKLEGFN